MEDRDPLTEKIIACCFKVHSELGPGFSEKTYHNALKIALKEASLEFDVEKEYTIIYQNKKVGSLKLDLIIGNQVIVELKAITGVWPDVFRHQLLSYLNVANLSVGLLVNFGNKSCQVRRYML